MTVCRLMCLTFVSLLFSAAASAQNPVVITGRVADPQGGVIVGAHVTLGAPGQPPRTTETRADGTFSFDQVAPGRSTLRIESPGFVAATQDLSVPAESSLMATLQVAGLAEDVVVSGGAPLRLSLPEATASRLELPPLETPLRRDVEPERSRERWKQ
jgi:Carboxypeptidase regulatory-like domain